MSNKGSETEELARTRFQIELEFIQCLGNPHYLNFLAQRGYFKQMNFINYLKYLLYWKDAEYAKYIKYPVCLYFLDLLQHEHFRNEIANARCAKFIDDQILLLWQHYTRRRSKLLQNAVEPQPSSSSCPVAVDENVDGNELPLQATEEPPLVN